MISLIIGIVVSLLVVFFGTPVLINIVHKLHYGQYIRQDGPKSHQVKRGTPTMGGLIIVLAIVLGWGASAICRPCSIPRWCCWLRGSRSRPGCSSATTRRARRRSSTRSTPCASSEG